MTPEIAEQTVRYILNTRAEDTLRITWFGGEPLLCPDIIDGISNQLQAADVPYLSSMVSNGSLITPTILDKMLHEWKMHRIQISLDGAEQDYIARKRYHGNQDRYHFVLNAIDQMSAAGITVAVRCNVDEENWGNIPQFMDDLRQYISHKEHVSVYFSPLGEVRIGEKGPDLWRKIIDARQLITDAGFHPLSYMGMHMKFRTNYCMADAGSTVIGPDGSLYACEHCSQESRFGDVFNGVTDENAKRAFCRTDRPKEKCRKCPFLPECTGFSSCPWYDAHCREVREMIALDALHRLAEQKEPNNTANEDDLVC